MTLWHSSSLQRITMSLISNHVDGKYVYCLSLYVSQYHPHQRLTALLPNQLAETIKERLTSFSKSNWKKKQIWKHLRWFSFSSWLSLSSFRWGRNTLLVTTSLRLKIMTVPCPPIGQRRWMLPSRLRTKGMITVSLKLSATTICLVCWSSKNKKEPSKSAGWKKHKKLGSVQSVMG